MKKQANKIYKTLQKNKNRIKIRALLMSGFLLAVNSFAWFVFISNGNSKINADVISWDIAFFDEEAQVEILDINLDDLYPGMETFSKSIVVKNRSDLEATFSYEVEEVIVYNEQFLSDNLIDSLEKDFPFSITFTYDKTDLAVSDQLNFKVFVSWPFESSKSYYKLNRLYPYSSIINYYDDTYKLIEVNQQDYYDYVDNGLYVESDDADTYWGEKSVTFRKQHPDKSAISLKLKLIVTQKNT